MTPDRQPVDFGARLKEARLRKGVSLRAISDLTRISVAVLESMERNDISKLPGGIFSRAFVRAFAQEVDLDPERTVEQFIEQFPDDSVTVGHTSSASWDELEARETRRRRVLAVFKLAAALALIGGGVYYGLHRTSLWSVQRWTAPIMKAVASMNPAAVAASSPAADHLTINVAGLRASTASVATDGTASQSFILMAGERRVFEAARDVSLQLSDPTALTLTINGAAVKTLGSGDEAVSLQLTLANYREFLAP